MSRIVVGMSGGVDSSVAAYILKRQGHEVIGVFMNNWEETDENGRCSADMDYEDAKSVSLKLAIPFYAVNFAKEYWDNVFTYFIDEYRNFRTPNPDVLCNSEIKFKSFLKYAEETFGADKIATGHYARNDVSAEEVRLLKGADRNKDQSYFLSFLTREQVAKAVFPIGDMQKSQVREMAAELGLRTASKKDSTGICFIGERNFTKFLMNYLPTQKGDIVDADAMKRVGEHKGLMYYTMLQRKGLGIGSTGLGERWYVCEKDVKNNILYVVQGRDNPKLFSYGFTSEKVNFINPLPAGEKKCTVKYRYRQAEKACVLKVGDGGKCTVVFDEPQAGITPGQVGVFYEGDICLGGAIIDKALKTLSI